MTRKERYDYRRAHGLCVQCGKPVEGEVKTARCAACQAKTNKFQNEIRNFHRQHGRCPECGGPLADDGCKICPKCRADRRQTYYDHCNEHTKRVKKYNKKRRKNFLKKGLCSYCGKAPVVEGKTGCAECLKKRAGQQKKYRHMRAYDAKFYLPVKKVV